MMLPHLRGRPLTLHRFPDGIGAHGFYQQNRSDYFPDWLPAASIDHPGGTGTVTHILCERAADLVYLASQATLTLHAWLSRVDRPHRPDQLVFDLDPPGDDFEPVRRAAWQVGDALRDAGLTPFVKTTGSRGLHVVAPLKPGADFDRVRRACRRLAKGRRDSPAGQTSAPPPQDGKRRGTLLAVEFGNVQLGRLGGAAGIGAHPDVILARLRVVEADRRIGAVAAVIIARCGNAQR